MAGDSGTGNSGEGRGSGERKATAIGMETHPARGRSKPEKERGVSALGILMTWRSAGGLYEKGRRDAGGKRTSSHQDRSSGRPWGGHMWEGEGGKKGRLVRASAATQTSSNSRRGNARGWREKRKEEDTPRTSFKKIYGPVEFLSPTVIFFCEDCHCDLDAG